MCYRNTTNQTTVLGACALELKGNYTQKQFFIEFSQTSFSVKCDFESQFLNKT
jgi:hypothetical protein